MVVSRVMRRAWCLVAWMSALGAGLVATHAQQASPAPSPAATTVGTTASQLMIHGGTGADRASISSQANELRKEFCAVLRRPEEVHFRWVIKLHESDGSSRPVQVVGSLGPVPDVKPNYEFLVDVRLDPSLTEAEFQTVFVRMLIQEQMIHPPDRPVTQFNNVPAWLLAGIEELIYYRRTTLPADVYAYLVKNREVLSLQDVMSADPTVISDSVSKRVYRACCAALVQALLDQVRGPLSLKEFMEDLAVETTPALALLQRHFPALNQDEKALEKWWVLQMASMSQRSAFEYMDVAETEEFIDQALVVRYKAFVDQAKAAGKPEFANESGFFSKIPGTIKTLPKSIPFIGRDGKAGPAFEKGRVQDFEKFINLPYGRDVLRQNREQLLQIRDRAFPVYRPIVAAYDTILGRLVEGDTKDVAKQLAELDRQRAELRQLMEDITDHMNWFAATQLETESDAFDGYESALKYLKSLEERKRADPMSSYLDAVERELAP